MNRTINSSIYKKRMPVFLSITSIILLLLSISLVIPVYAQSQTLNLDETPIILPDNTFYGLKRAIESIQLVVTFDDNAKAVKQTEIAEERLKEIKAMAERGRPDLIQKLEDDYSESIDEAIKTSQKLPSDNKGLQVKAFVHQKLQEHDSKLGLFVSEFTRNISDNTKTCANIDQVSSSSSGSTGASDTSGGSSSYGGSSSSSTGQQSANAGQQSANAGQPSANAGLLSLIQKPQILDDTQICASKNILNSIKEKTRNNEKQFNP